MPLDLNKLWAECLMLLEDEVTPVGYSTWIKDIKPVSLSEDTFVLSVGSTIINVSGGQSNDKQTLLLAVAPTKMYFVIKEGLKEIDKNIFYLVCDSYEVSGKGDD